MQSHCFLVLASLKSPSHLFDPQGVSESLAKSEHSEVSVNLTLYLGLKISLGILPCNLTLDAQLEGVLQSQKFSLLDLLFWLDPDKESSKPTKQQQTKTCLVMWSCCSSSHFEVFQGSLFLILKLSLWKTDGDKQGSKRSIDCKGERGERFTIAIGSVLMAV